MHHQLSMMPGAQPMNPMMNFPNMQMSFNQPAPPGHSLYVGNISPSISEEILMQLFSRFGEPSNVRIMKDTFTKKSREFGFVTFFNKEDALKAQKEMNNTIQFGRELRVYVKKNLKSLPKDANVVLRNLNKRISSRELTDHCSSFGEIISCYVKTQMVDNVSESCGYGYVQYNDSAAAKKCIEEMNGKEINGQTVVAEIFVPSSQREKPGLSNLYIKDFPEDWDQTRIEQWLDQEFSAFGKIQSKAVFIDKNHKKFYAFVALDSPEAASKAQQTIHGKQVEEGGTGSAIYVNIAIPKNRRLRQIQSQRAKKKNETNIYLRSIKMEVSEEQLKTVFQKYGEITSTCLKEWEGNVGSGISKKQFAFINYVDPKSAQELMAKYKDDQDIRALIDEGTDSNFLFFAQTKQQRMQFLRMQRQNNMFAQMQKGPGNPYMQMMMRNQMGFPPGGMGAMMGFGGGFGNRPGMNPMMGARNMNRMMNMMGGMNNMNNMRAMPNSQPMFGMMGNQGPMSSMNPMANFQAGPQAAMGIRPNMMNQQMFAPNQDMNMLSAQMSGMNLNAPPPGMGQKDVPFQPNGQMTGPMQTKSREGPETQEEWEKIGKTEDLHSQTGIIRKFKNQFSNLPEEFQLQMLGDLIYSALEDHGLQNEDQKRQITGMINDYEVLNLEEILELLVNPETMKERINEAIELIQQEPDADSEEEVED